MENVVRGALKLKKPLDGKKKKKSKSKELAVSAGGGGSSSKDAAKADSEKSAPLQASLSSPSSSDSSGDERTAYEKKWDEQSKRVDAKNAQVAASKSHRDKINDFNEKLSKMSEHYDLPRVAGGG